MNIEQVAVEAEADLWYSGEQTLVRQQHNRNIIKTAIEKAYAEGFVHGRSKRPYSDSGIRFAPNTDAAEYPAPDEARDAFLNDYDGASHEAETT